MLRTWIRTSRLVSVTLLTVPTPLGPHLYQVCFLPGLPDRGGPLLLLSHSIARPLSVCVVFAGL